MTEGRGGTKERQMAGEEGNHGLLVRAGLLLRHKTIRHRRSEESRTEEMGEHRRDEERETYIHLCL
jgi:hypothetical protein